MTSYEIVITIVQFLALLVLGGTLFIFWRQSRTTQREFKVRMRPYLGFTEIIRKEIEEPDKLEFEVNVRNFGALPAKDAKLYGEFIVNHEGHTPFECTTRGSVFPSDKPESMWRLVATDIDRDTVLNGSTILELKLTIEYYDSSGERYWTSTNRMYDYQRNDWMNEEGSWA